MKRPDFSTVMVVGLGYVGLPTAALIASRGFQVIGLDNNPDVVSTINSGRVHIVEADLDGLVQKVVGSGLLRAVEAPVPADVYLIAVPTPITEDKLPNIGLVHDAARSIAPVLKKGDLVILESTSQIGTTEAISELLGELRPDLSMPTAVGEAADVSVAYCPERILPGRVLAELVSNDRCIGGISRRCARRAQRFYTTFVRGTCFRTTARTAEFVKLAENSFRDTNIALANELSLICERFGIDTWEAVGLANRHPRVNILKPGPGVGGHCIAVDPWFMVASAPDLANVIRTARVVNDGRVAHTVERCIEVIERGDADAPIACFGLAYKADIDDLRESPALDIATELCRRYGSRIRIVEPNIQTLPKDLADLGAELTDTDSALAAGGILLLLVDHEEFKMIAPEERAGALTYDSRGIWRATEAAVD
ncbi:UDP-N-acetyl-D-mannosamine dehydrogenase [Bauldia litoralis]|uniref:UDP-N-acetyl-D-mannosamine dehydrogenase n=1 Tax=Bauldia litoralis TaxID=665467 RepID=UPI003265AC5A